MIAASKSAIKSGVNFTRNAIDWLGLADHLVQAERTAFDILYQEDIERLRHYRPLTEASIVINGQEIPVEKKRHKTPVLIVAPLAVNMYIYDLFPTRSFVRFLLAKGFDVYMVDWGKPTAAHNHYHISTYFDEILPRMISEVRQHSGSQKISLHGWSFGGLFSYCYAAKSGDADIANIVLVGAPCDYHRNGDIGKIYQRLSRSLKKAESVAGFRVHNTRRRYWRSPGWRNALAFKLTNPVASVQGYTTLIRNLHDRQFVANHATNAAFLDRMEAYPGGVIQDCIQYLWVDNVVAEGRLPMPGTPELLNAVRASIFSVSGKQDPICTPECTTRLLQLVGSDDQSSHLVAGGHMGILGGSAAPENSWFTMAEWLAARS